MEMNIFENASRKKLRFPSPVGDLMTEQLWDLPLTSKNGASLDGLARSTNRQLKDLGDESFVNVRPDPRVGELQLQLDILKRVIEVKMKIKAAAEAATERAQRRSKLLSVLAAKEEDELKGMTREQIEKELAAL